MGGSVTTPTESTRLLGASQPAGPQPFSAIAQPQQALQGRGSQQQQHQGHRHHEPHVVEVDPVERLVKHTLMAAAAFLLLGFLGVLALVLKALGFDRLPWLARLPPALHSYWAVFAPFWIADLVGLAFVVYLFYGVCTLRTATRDEKRTVTRYARAYVCRWLDRT